LRHSRHALDLLGSEKRFGPKVLHFPSNPAWIGAGIEVRNGVNARSTVNQAMPERLLPYAVRSNSTEASDHYTRLPCHGFSSIRFAEKSSMSLQYGFLSAKRTRSFTTLTAETPQAALSLLSLKPWVKSKPNPRENMMSPRAA
jgi:hypothetical protein